MNEREETFGHKQGILEIDKRSIDLIVSLALRQETRKTAHDIAQCFSILYKSRNVDYFQLKEYVMHLEKLADAERSNDQKTIKMEKEIILPKFEKGISEDRERIVALLDELRDGMLRIDKEKVVAKGQEYDVLEAELKAIEMIVSLAQNRETNAAASGLAICLAIMHETQNTDFINLNEYVLNVDDLAIAESKGDQKTIKMEKEIILPRFEKDICEDRERIMALLNGRKSQESKASQ